MASYIKRPIVVEAEQWFPGKTIASVGHDPFVGESGAYVRTIHGDRLPLEPGDWVIQEPMPGRAYKCSPEAFRMIYDSFPGVSQDAPAASAD
jgi:hypothetical protein